MTARRIAIVPGDGIGPEITEAVLRILEEAGFEAQYTFLEAGQPSIDKGGIAMPDATVQAIREIGVALKGPTATPVGKGHVSANVTLRKKLDLFANVRPTRVTPGVTTPFSDRDLDLVIVRENTEDLYAGIEFMPTPDLAQSIKVITRGACMRICEYAFDMARKQGRKRVTAVHKANIMKMSDGMFLDEFYKVAASYTDIKGDDIIVDNCCMQLVVRPETFDVLVTENLYGDIVSDLCAGLVGGLGLAPGANIGTRNAVFEAVHGSAPDIAGRGIANPTALLSSALLMLRHIGEHAMADRIQAAVTKVLREGKTVTGDLGGTATTVQYRDEVIRSLGQ